MRTGIAMLDVYENACLAHIQKDFLERGLQGFFAEPMSPKRFVADGDDHFDRIFRAVNRAQETDGPLKGLINHPESTVLIEERR